MKSSAPTPETKPEARPQRPSRSRRSSVVGSGTGSIHGAVLAEAKSLGLLDGEKNAHVSFRVPLALLEAAKQETGVVSTSEVGVLALALLAQPDPVVAFLRRTRGRLGRHHTLDV